MFAIKMPASIRKESTVPTMEQRLDGASAATTTTTTRRRQTRKSVHHDLTSAATIAHKCQKPTRANTVTWRRLATLTLVLGCALVAAAAAAAQDSRSRSLEFNANGHSIAHRGRPSLHHLPEGYQPERETPASYHQLTSQDLASADQLDEPTFISSMSDEIDEPRRAQVDARVASRDDQNENDDEPILLDNFSESAGSSARARQRRGDSLSRANAYHPTITSEESGGGGGGQDQGEEVAAQDSQDAMPDRSAFMGHDSDHNSQLRAMRDMFERRQMSAGGGGGGPHINNNNNNINHHHHHRPHRSGGNQQPQLQPNSQELSPISIGLDPPFAMPSPFQMGDGPAPPLPLGKPQMADGNEGAGQPLGGFPFGANPLPHLLGFQSTAFDGPQRGDQSAHSHHHAAAAPGAESDSPAGPGSTSPKVWPKIFRFTDGRINLSDFEKQKKIRLSSKNQHGENHIESAPIMFDNRQLKRKSFLILHGGVFPS